MKTNFKEKEQAKLVERGDVLVLKDRRRLLVISIKDDNRPFSLVDIEEMKEVEVCESLSKIKDKYENEIARIIKHENLEIREAE